MASSKFQELKSFSDEDLKAELVSTQEQYGKLKFDHAVRGLDNPLILTAARKDIARLKTEIRRREIEAMSEEEIANRAKIRERRR